MSNNIPPNKEKAMKTKVPYVTHVAGEFWICWQVNGELGRCVNRAGVRRSGLLTSLPVVKPLAIVNGKKDKYAITKDGYLNLTTGQWADKDLEKVIRAYLHTDRKQTDGWKPKKTQTYVPRVTRLSDSDIDVMGANMNPRYNK